MYSLPLHNTQIPNKGEEMSVTNLLERFRFYFLRFLRDTQNQNQYTGRTRHSLPHPPLTVLLPEKRNLEQDSEVSQPLRPLCHSQRRPQGSKHLRNNEAMCSKSSRYPLLSLWLVPPLYPPALLKNGKSPITHHARQCHRLGKLRG